MVNDDLMDFNVTVAEGNKMKYIQSQLGHVKTSTTLDSHCDNCNKNQLFQVLIFFKLFRLIQI